MLPSQTTMKNSFLHISSIFWIKTFMYSLYFSPKGQKLVFFWKCFTHHSVFGFHQKELNHYMHQKSFLQFWNFTTLHENRGTNIEVSFPTEGFLKQEGLKKLRQMSPNRNRSELFITLQTHELQGLLVPIWKALICFI